MSRLPSTGPSLVRKLREAQRQALRQAQSSAFTRSGASVSNPGMLSSDDFDGVDRTHLGTSGWALGSDDGGPSYFVLNGRDVFADLAAKDAALTAQQADLAAQLVSINALIGAQVDFGGIGFSTTGFNVTTSSTAVITRTITIPTGFTKAVILGISTAGCMNGSASVGLLYIQTVIVAGSGGGAIMPSDYASPTYYAFVGSSAMRTMTGLAPGSITVKTYISASDAWGTNASNIANLDAIAIFGR